MNGTVPPVTFSYDVWVASFPEFSPLTPAQGQAYFNQATLICGNSCSNPINADGNLAALLYILTAHFAWLNCAKDANGNPSATGTPNPLVGRVADASQGTVSVSTEWNSGGSPSDLEAFLIQTKYGSQYWAATAQYRTARYLANPTRVVNGLYPGIFSPTLWPWAS